MNDKITMKLKKLFYSVVIISAIFCIAPSNVWAPTGLEGIYAAVLIVWISIGILILVTLIIVILVIRWINLKRKDRLKKDES